MAAADEVVLEIDVDVLKTVSLFCLRIRGAGEIQRGASDVEGSGRRGVLRVPVASFVFELGSGTREGWRDVNALIEETLTLVQAELQQNRILVRTESNGELPQVIGDRTQLQQVLLNLITNAIEAMAAKEGLRTLGVRSDVNENGGVAVSIADTGRGIKPQEIEQIFNPLFTTKPDGMGMGLFICRSIVESHGGNLLVFPNSPQGVVFQMVLHAGTPASA